VFCTSCKASEVMSETIDERQPQGLPPACCARVIREMQLLIQLRKILISHDTVSAITKRSNFAL
jgi:hypothetical protein